MRAARPHLRRGLALVVASVLAVPVGGAGTALATPARRRRAATTAVAKGIIRVGLIASEHGGRGQPIPLEAKQIADAWAAIQNAAGGINGYRFQIVYRNVDGDARKAVQAVREIDAAGALALTTGDASVMPAVADLLVQRSLPAIGGQPYTPEWDWHPMLFPVEAGPAAGSYGQVAAARDVGATHFRNVYCAELPACLESVKPTRYAAQREGLRFTAQAAPGTAADYTATCVAAKADDADFFQANGLDFAAVVRDCSRVGYHPIYGVGGSASAGVIDQAKGERLAGDLFEVGVFYDGHELAAFRRALARTSFRVADGSATQRSVQTWLALEMIGAIARRLLVAKPTRSDFLNAAYMVKGETLGGQIAPMDYTVQRPGTGGHAASDCWTEHVVKDGRYLHMDKSGAPVSRLTFVCGTGLRYDDHSPPHE